MDIIETMDLGEGWEARIYRDEWPLNPWKDWDCEPPIAVLSYDRLQDDSRIVRDSLVVVSDWKLARHWREIAESLGECPKAFESRVKHHAWNYRQSLGDARRDLLGELLFNANPGDAMKAAAACYRIAGIEALATARHGYCQGDRAELLIVATPEWAKLTGAPRETHARQLEAAADLWAAWAYGDVYGYVIMRPDGEESGVSGWGFYGNDYEKSGLMEAARDALAEAKAELIDEVARAFV